MEKRGNTREKILLAATSLFGAHGIDGVTTRLIARQVGISQPSIYAHFGSVQEIHEAVSARAFALLELRLRERPDLSPPEEFAHMMRSYFDFGLENPDAYRIAFMREYERHESQGNATDTSAEFHTTDHPGPLAYGHFARVMTRLRPDLPYDERDLRTQNLWAAAHGLISLLLARPDFPWADKARLVSAHIRMISHMASL